MSLLAQSNCYYNLQQQQHISSHLRLGKTKPEMGKLIKYWIEAYVGTLISAFAVLGNRELGLYPVAYNQVLI